MIEAEIRAFINDSEFLRLKQFFDSSAKFIKEDEQETHYLDFDIDLRIQQAREYSKVWLKKGKIHDKAREEIEIKTKRENFEELKKLFSALGYETKVKWLRRRLQYNWEGVKVSLDNTKGYGKIIELEKQTDENNKEKTLEELKEKIKALGIKLTPKEDFEIKYKEYIRQNSTLC